MIGLPVGIHVFFNWHRIVTFSAQGLNNVHDVIWTVKLLEITRHDRADKLTLQQTNQLKSKLINIEQVCIQSTYFDIILFNMAGLAENLPSLR